MTNATAGDITERDVEKLSPGDVDADRLRAAFDHEEGLVRDRAADICLTFAAEDIEAVMPLLPSLSEVLDDDNVNVVLKAITTVNLIAEERPAELEETVSNLCTLLTHELPRVQLFASRAIQKIGAEHPEWFLAHTETLLTALRSEIEDPTEGIEELDGIIGDVPLQKQFHNVRRGTQIQQYTVQAVAGNLLIEIADREPQAVVPYAEEIVELLSAEDANIVAAAAEAVGNVAASNPDAVGDAVDPLCNCLHSTSEVAVARAAIALGHIGDSRAAEPLWKVARDDDRDENLRDLAAETAEWLESQV